MSGGALAGWRVLVPRPAERSADLRAALAERGAEVVAVPFLTIEPPADGAALDAALRGLASGAYGWIGFTSVNALRAVTRRCAELGLTAVPPGTMVAAVGPGTARAIRAAGLPVDLVPATGGSAAALAAIWPAATAGAAVLLPRSDRAAPTLPDALQAKGYLVDAVVAYGTGTVVLDEDVAADLASGAIRAVLLTSPSTVEPLRGVRVAPTVVLGAIGAPTAQAIRDAGLQLSFVADEPSARGLVDGLAAIAGGR